MPELLINREARIFEAAKYEDKNVEFTEDDLDTLVENFTNPVPIKVEHINTPFDGALGFLTKIWRKGKELFGNIAFPPTVNSLIETADAKKLSIGISKDKKSVLELSIVNNPRVESATVFNGTECFVFNSENDIEFAALSIDDVGSRIYEALRKNNSYGYLHRIFTEPSYLIISQYGTYYKYDYTIVGEKITLSNKRKAVESWEDSDENAEVVIEELPDNSGSYYSRKENDMADEVKTVSVEEFKKQQEEFLKFKKTTYLNTANEFINEQVKLGKITSAGVDFAREIMTQGAEVGFTFNNESVSITDLFKRFIENQPKVLEFKEVLKTGKENKKTETTEEIDHDLKEKAAFLMTKFPGLTEEQLIESIKEQEKQNEVVFSLDDED